jgi:hypothetical protein
VGKLEQEIRRKPVEVALHLLVEPLGRNKVNAGQIHIQQKQLQPPTTQTTRKTYRLRKETASSNWRTSLSDLFFSLFGLFRGG